MVSWDQSSQLLSLALGFISNLITFCKIKSDLKNDFKVYNEKEKTMETILPQQNGERTYSQPGPQATWLHAHGRIGVGNSLSSLCSTHVLIYVWQTGLHNYFSYRAQLFQLSACGTFWASLKLKISYEVERKTGKCKVIMTWKWIQSWYLHQLVHLQETWTWLLWVYTLVRF